ncbi:GbsR/MarR family transcriptional regulator [Marinimicrococcus flavescens]|uniref:MarR family transcriptional regulator n=1 Tax=Marinimicrococcus flavescens TaxID=3031815 RepID=A0AAP3XSG8_9PROT|nr:MarR family transcriptional regulator [Marinimicrococcus flavescens]
MSGRNHDGTDQFIEQLGMVFQAEGLPRIAGRVMGLLVIEGGPMAFAAIAERLRISRGSVSTNTRLLEQMGVLERVAVPGERQDFFRLAAAPYVRLLSGLTQRMAKARDVVQRAGRSLPPDRHGAHQRLAELDEFYAEFGSSLARLIEQFSRRR